MQAMSSTRAHIRQARTPTPTHLLLQPLVGLQVLFFARRGGCELRLVVKQKSAAILAISYTEFQSSRHLSLSQLALHIRKLPPQIFHLITPFQQILLCTR